jgi:hypothetical protein
MCARPCLVASIRSCARGRAGEMRYAPEDGMDRLWTKKLDGECEDARDAAARDGVEWSGDMARRYLAGAREDEESGGETGEEYDKQDEVERG